MGMMKVAQQVDVALILRHLERLGYLDVFVDKSLESYLEKQGISVSKAKGKKPTLDFSEELSDAISKRVEK